MSNGAGEMKQAELSEKDRRIITGFRASVFFPFIFVAAVMIIFFILLPGIVRKHPAGPPITSAQLVSGLQAIILISFLPLIIYYYKTYNLVRKYKASANPVLMLVVLIISLAFPILPWVFAIHLWIKSSSLLKVSKTT